MTVSADQFLRAEDDREGEAVRVLTTRLGGVGQDSHVVRGDDQDVAVDSQDTDGRVIDQLALGRALVRLGRLRGPQLDEQRTADAEVRDEPLEVLIGGVATGSTAQVGGDACLELGPFIRCVDGPGARADEVAPRSPRARESTTCGDGDVARPCSSRVR